MKKKTGSTFAEDWAKNTYTGRAVKSVVEHFREPAYRPGKGDRLTTNPDVKKFGAPSKSVEDRRNEAPGKGDRQNDPSSPMKRVNDAAKKQKNFFSAARLKKS